MRRFIASMKEFDLELGQLTAFYALSPEVVVDLAKVSKAFPLLAPQAKESSQLSFAHPDLVAMRTSRALNTSHIEFGNEKLASFAP